MDDGYRSDNWDGQSKGNTLGNLIFMKLIAWGGPLSAYLLLIFVSLYYTIKDRKSKEYLREFRRNAGLKTGFQRFYRHFFSFGMGLIDGLAYLASDKPVFTHTCIGEEHIAGMLEKGKGVILLSAHVGNWEVAGNQLFKHLNTRVNILMLDNERESIQRVFKKATDNRMVNVIGLRPPDGGAEAMIQIHKALANNEIVCLLGDRVMGGMDSLTLPFLGIPARFPVGPFAIGAATKAPIVAVFALKRGLKHFENRAYASISFDDVTRQNRREKIKEAMKKYVSILEEVAKNNPYQWFNFYDYWGE